MKAQHFLIAAILVMATGSAAHANRTIDAFSDPFPAQTYSGSPSTSSGGRLNAL